MASLQCQAAAGIIRDAVLPSAPKAGERDIVFKQGSRIGSRTRSGELTDRFRNDPHGPPSDLLARLEAQGDVDAVSSCADVRLVLDQAGVRFDRRSIERGSRLKRNRETRAIIYETSLPVLSYDGKRALFIRKMHCGSRCGSGYLVHAERSAEGRWVILGEYWQGVS